MIPLADHLAKMAAVANPPAPPDPGPLPEHPMVASYKADLAKMGQLGTRQGLRVIETAEKFVSSATSPAATAGLSKELDRLMEELDSQSPRALADRDPSLIIRERTLAKLRAVTA